MNCQFAVPILLFVVSFSALRSAHCQLAVYGTAHYAASGYMLDESGNEQGYLYRHDNFGAGGGVTFMFPSDSGWKTGIDLRAAGTSSPKGGEFGALGFRGVFVPRSNPFMPYLQFGLGYVRTSYQTYSGTGPVGTSSFTTDEHRVGGFAPEFAFGLDVRLAPRVNFRLLEIDGYESPKVGAASFSTGFVFWPSLPRRKNP